MPLQLLHPMGRRYFGTPEGQIAVFISEMEQPGPNELRYRGPVCLLIGSFTFSSAMMLANAVEDFDLAMLIGEETGAIPNDFGEVYPFDLPHTRLSAGVSSARFVRANGDAEDRHGVRPGIEVRQTEEDRLNGVDTVLERAKSWIREASRAGRVTRAE
jgi:C-terminal processing protease CtpA/Prc